MTIAITEEAHDLIRVLAQRAWAVRKSEIGGFGWARQTSPSQALVYKIWPVKHEASGAGTSHLDEDQVHVELTRLDAESREAARRVAANEDLGGLNPEAYADFRVWWHTHPGGPDDFSTTDRTTISEDLPKVLKRDWNIALLTNGNWVKGELHVSIPWAFYLVEKDLKPVRVEPKKETEHPLDALVREMLPEKQPYRGKMWTPGDTAVFSNFHNGRVPPFSEVKWARCCVAATCVKQPRFVSQWGAQYCKDCVASQYKGATIVYDRYSPRAERDGLIPEETRKRFFPDSRQVSNIYLTSGPADKTVYGWELLGSSSESRLPTPYSAWEGAYE